MDFFDDLEISFLIELIISENMCRFGKKYINIFCHVRARACSISYIILCEKKEKTIREPLNIVCDVTKEMLAKNDI